MMKSPTASVPRSKRIAASISLAAALALLGWGTPARAHPHVWVTVETTVLFDQGSITGFRHKWTFDELYTAMAIEGLDTNKDGKYSREELAELAKVNIDGLKEFGFFTHARLAGQELALDQAKDYWLEHAKAPPDPGAAPQKVLPRQSEAAKPGFLARFWSLIFGGAPSETANADAPGDILSLHFTLPLKQPVLAEAPEFAFSIYDTSFFIAFDMSKGTPVKLGEGAPAGCRIDLGTPEKSPDDAQKLGEAFAARLGTDNFGLAASRPIKIVCGPRS